MPLSKHAQAAAQETIKQRVLWFVRGYQEATGRKPTTEEFWGVLEEEDSYYTELFSLEDVHFLIQEI